MDKLPAELIGRIRQVLPLRDRLNFSLTSSRYRRYLIPYLYSKIRITNLEEDEDLRANFISKYGQYTRELWFQCYLFPNADDDSLLRVGDDSDDKAPEAEKAKNVIPEYVAKILRGDILPRITNITVEFKPEDDFGQEGWADSEGSIYMHDEAENDEEIPNIELRWSWRSLMARVWEHIAWNFKIKELGIVSLPPKNTSTWLMPHWKAFLGRLDSLSVELWGGDNGAGWHSNTLYGYLSFLEHLDQFFFEHATSLRCLSIKADTGNPYGGHDHSAPIALGKRYSPKLEFLRLQNCILDANLVQFLSLNSKQLKKLHLIDCMSTWGQYTPTEFSWEAFFHSLEGSQPILSELVVTNQRIPLTGDEEFSETDTYNPPEIEEPQVKLARERLKVEPDARIFSYNRLDDKYGMVFCDEETNLERFESGEDLAEYHRLMEVVKSNAESAS